MELRNISSSYSKFKQLIQYQTKNYLKEYSFILITLILLQLIIYTYLFTTIIFTNHTLPNTWLNNYPTIKTIAEGRWFADILKQLQGGSGVQSLQMALAIILQSVNGILLTKIINLKNKIEIFIVAATLCFYPAFFDYYSYATDHFSFVLGDTFALLGAYFLIRKNYKLNWALLSVFLYTLSMSAYGPKISLVTLLSSMILLISNFTVNTKSSTKGLFLFGIKNISVVFFTTALAIFLFWLSTVITITMKSVPRNQLNDFSGIMSEIINSYKWFVNFYLRNNKAADLIKYLPVSLIFLGILSILIKQSSKNKVLLLTFTLLLIGIQPILLRMSYVINSNSFEYSGRILTANGYFLLFYVSFGLLSKWSNLLVRTVTIICLYFFITLASQNNNAAAFKSEYEMNFINRIAYRIETVLESSPSIQNPVSLVIVGHIPAFDHSKYRKKPILNYSDNINGKTFIFYRQKEYLNFFLGREAFRRPTKKEIQKVIPIVKNKLSWPSKESVFFEEDIMVVILEPYKEGINTTITSK